MDDIKLETKELNKIDIKSYNLQELTEFVVGLGDKKFRAKQIYEWLHQKLVVSFDEMSNLPVSFRERLKETCRLTALEPVSVQVSQLDGTTKYLFELYDGNVIESVLMIYNTVIQYVFLHRLDAGWAVDSVRPH